jgi:hypothetical protein
MKSLKTVHTDGKENSASGPKTKGKERAPNLWRILQSGGRRTKKIGEPISNWSEPSLLDEKPEVLPLGALRCGKTNFLTIFRPSTSSQMRIKGSLRKIPLDPIKIEEKLSNL